jgi:prepilin-type N-terminal cleavage/methylation domain-containing protein
MFNRKGFTLIELLIVVVIIGLLASIASPKFAATKDKAKMASVRSDIRNTMTAQEAYFADYNTFGDLAQLQLNSNYLLSLGNTGSVVPNVSGYTATISNSTITTGLTQCTVQAGAGAASSIDGIIICSRSERQVPVARADRTFSRSTDPARRTTPCASSSSIPTISFIAPSALHSTRPAMKCCCDGIRRRPWSKRTRAASKA